MELLFPCLYKFEKCKHFSKIIKMNCRHYSPIDCSCEFLLLKQIPQFFLAKNKTLIQSHLKLSFFPKTIFFHSDLNLVYLYNIQFCLYVKKCRYAFKYLSLF